MTISRIVGVSLVVFAVPFILAVPAAAGSVNLVWDSSPGATGYKVYSGATSGEYGPPSTVGSAPQATVGAISNCTATYFAVKAFNSAGDSGFSNEIASWPRPELGGLNPLDGQQGTTLDVAITGNNFEPNASVQFSGSGITVNSVTRSSCGQITVNITISASASFGTRDVRVVNSNGVTGIAPGLFSVVGVPLPEVQNLRRTDQQP